MTSAASRSRSKYVIVRCALVWRRYEYLLFSDGARLVICDATMPVANEQQRRRLFRFSYQGNHPPDAFGGLLLFAKKSIRFVLGRILCVVSNFPLEIFCLVQFAQVRMLVHCNIAVCVVCVRDDNHFRYIVTALYGIFLT